ncbi:uncharacterized protein BDW43DRAFT_166882 [Aspergillus alliaceus]|uniref:uncharacterized protein n=1 Tax=Petromyces alliaceus TaxID=209559 RepID=UPI0012A412E3|nr:uncharacterized protein BDW43DRAFT_166882 [Aspergillus alliaceus]KAB8230387.1 hypothetical protein BDW43DRAFT_166882 [Aspergillus alliaceus]
MRLSHSNACICQLPLAPFIVWLCHLVMSCEVHYHILLFLDIYLSKRMLHANLLLLMIDLLTDLMFISEILRVII